jgi:hypothetical protein
MLLPPVMYTIYYIVEDDKIIDVMFLLRRMPKNKTSDAVEVFLGLNRISNLIECTDEKELTGGEVLSAFE